MEDILGEPNDGLDVFEDDVFLILPLAVVGVIKGKVVVGVGSEKLGDLGSIASFLIGLTSLRVGGSSGRAKYEYAVRIGNKAREGMETRVRKENVSKKQRSSHLRSATSSLLQVPSCRCYSIQ